MTARLLAPVTLVLATLTAPSGAIPGQAGRPVDALIADLRAAAPDTRAAAACALRDLGSAAAPALPTLVALLPDGAPVSREVCEARWQGHPGNELTTPGEEAAAALVAIGARAFEPLVATLHHAAWIARRNAAWALGALDDRQAVEPLAAALRDSDAEVRSRAAWALGAIGDTGASAALVAALRDSNARVRQQAAWALGAVGDPSAVDGLVKALEDAEPRVRQQAAWALGAIGDSRALPGLLAVLKDDSAPVRRQAAWAVGAIGR